jgi:hypothetical protein
VRWAGGGRQRVTSALPTQVRALDRAGVGARAGRARCSTQQPATAASLLQPTCTVKSVCRRSERRGPSRSAGSGDSPTARCSAPARTHSARVRAPQRQPRERRPRMACGQSRLRPWLRPAHPRAARPRPAA